MAKRKAGPRYERTEGHCGRGRERERGGGGEGSKRGNASFRSCSMGVGMISMRTYLEDLDLDLDQGAEKEGGRVGSE